jgi:hypothetical protein
MAMRAPSKNRLEHMKATQMSNSIQSPTLDALKGQAKRLRAALAADGDLISHCEALELIAKQNGYRDWNTLHAPAVKQASQPLSVGAP